MVFPGAADTFFPLITNSTDRDVRSISVAIIIPVVFVFRPLKLKSQLFPEKRVPSGTDAPLSFFNSAYIADRHALGAPYALGKLNYMRIFLCSCYRAYATSRYAE